MGIFRPGMFQRRGTASAPKEQETPARPPECDVCGLPDHDRADCWAVIKGRGDIERTWSGSRWSAGEGDTFQLMREWWRRVHEER